MSPGRASSEKNSFISAMSRTCICSFVGSASQARTAARPASVMS